jgi:hypothetical protein
MSVTAIIVDGSDRPLVGTTVVMPPERVERGGRRWLAVGIGLLTGVIAIGASGPQPSVPGRPTQPGRPPIAADLADRIPKPTATPLDDAVVWAPWRAWVDPRTGTTVRVAADPAVLARMLEDRLGAGRAT